MHFHCFYFAEGKDAALGKSPSPKWGNSGSPHGFSHGMSSCPLWPCTALLFLFQRNYLRYWVSLHSQFHFFPMLFLWELWDEMFLTSRTASAFPFQVYVLQIWVSLPPYREGIWGLPMGSAMGWSSDPSHHAFPICFFCRETSWSTGYVSSLKLQMLRSACGWYVPFIMCCFSLSFTEEQAEQLGESS